MAVTGRIKNVEIVMIIKAMRSTCIAFFYKNCCKATLYLLFDAKKNDAMRKRKHGKVTMNM